jgi:hypothetical protein
MEGAKKSVEPFHTRTRPIERVEEKPHEGAVFFQKQIVFRDRERVCVEKIKMWFAWQG